jgi:uncharacterized 2Fe-2S/4Fe-4S cluster protein (DUF4445 family)
MYVKATAKLLVMKAACEKTKVKTLHIPGAMANYMHQKIALEVMKQFKFTVETVTLPSIMW